MVRPGRLPAGWLLVAHTWCSSTCSSILCFPKVGVWIQRPTKINVCLIPLAGAHYGVLGGTSYLFFTLLIVVTDAQSLDTLIHWRIQRGDFLILSFCFHSLTGKGLQGDASLHPLFGCPLVQLIEERQDTGSIFSFST